LQTSTKDPESPEKERERERDIPAPEVETAINSIRLPSEEFGSEREGARQRKRERERHGQ